ncbi:MAG: LysR substrate-binding domain-containing protein [Parvibaculaceae bacterium]
MKRGSIPSLHALLVFECAGRHASFSRAAAELNLTQGAISQQVKQLEDHLGFPLFERIRQRVVLTAQGRAYMASIRHTLAELAETTHRARALAGSPTINLAVVPTFSTYWLMPRLPEFLAQHADFTIIFQTRLASFDFRGQGVDAAIHNGEPTWSGAAADYLMTEEVLPVCSPEFRRRHRLEEPADANRVRLLHLSTRFAAWNDWFERAGISDKKAFRIRGLAFDQFGIMARAAAAGAGIALLPRFLVEAEVAAGHLEILFKDVPPPSHSYYFVYSAGLPLTPALAEFRVWLLDQIGADMTPRKRSA